MIDELPPDGAERLIVDVLQNRSDEYRYSVACLVRGGPLVEEIEAMGVPVHIFGVRPGFDPWAVAKVFRWLRKEQVDIVHTHLFSADSYGRLAAWLAGVPGRFSTRHNTSQWAGSFRPRLARALSRISTAVIACGAEVGQFLKEHEGVPPNKIVVIPNGINLRRFAHIDRQAFRREIGVPEDVPLLGVIGRLHPQKGHEDLLAALSRLREHGTVFRCAIVGSGELYESIAAQIAARDLQSFVTLTGQRSDIANVLGGIDVFVMSSRWEGLPMALLEAMATGKAIVSTSVGGIPSVVTPGHDGLLVPPEKPEELADALLKVVTDAGLRKTLGENAKRTAEAKYSASTVARRYEALYAEALRAAS